MRGSGAPRCRRAESVLVGNAKPLGAFFGKTKLRHITSAHISDYQNIRTNHDAPKTVDGERSVVVR
jgi:hypothetical protein